MNKKQSKETYAQAVAAIMAALTEGKMTHQEAAGCLMGEALAHQDELSQTDKEELASFVAGASLP